jgi:hypothetical protein
LAAITLPQEANFPLATYHLVKIADHENSIGFRSGSAIAIASKFDANVDELASKLNHFIFILNSNPHDFYK